MRLSRLVTRSWFYFRMGYSTYLTFVMGYISTLVTVYYLAIKDVPNLLSLFPRFIPFAALSTVIGLPLSIGLGWTHYKRSPAFSAEQDIQAEANPYYFKYPPGYWKEALGPLYLEILLLLTKLSSTQQLLTDEDNKRILQLQEKLRTLNEGAMVGAHRLNRPK